MKRFTRFSCIGWFCWFWGSSWAATPAFDCANATHEIELLICSDDELAALDRQMDQTYRTAMKRLPEEDRRLQKVILLMALIRVLVGQFITSFPNRPKH